jgi:hypothetical protein
MTSLLAIVAFISLVIPIALVLRPLGDSLFLAPLMAFCLGVISASLAIIFKTSIMVTYVLAASALVGICFTWKKTRTLIFGNARIPFNHFDLIFLSIFVIFGIAFLIYIPPPLAFDARSIWLFHASWLSHGGGAFAIAQTLDSVSFSHPSYPFGGPAAVAIVWQLSGTEESLWLGVRVIAFLALANTIFVTKVLLVPFARKTQALGLTLLAVSLCTVIFLSVDGLALIGYMDILLATNIALTLAALLAILVCSNQLETDIGSNQLVIIAALAIFAAVSLKQEGIFFSLVLVVAFALVSITKSLKFTVLLVSALSSYAFWKTAIVISGGTSESDASGILNNIPEILDLNSTAWANFGVIWTAYFNGYLFFPNIIFLVALFSLLTEPKARRLLKIVSFVSVAWIGIWLVILTPYMFGETREHLSWWLGTSFNRIVATQLVFTFTFCGFVLARVMTNIHTDKKPDFDSDVFELERQR